MIPALNTLTVPGFHFHSSRSFRKQKKKTLPFVRKHLFGPHGTSDVIWPKSPRGINYSGSDIWMRPHDMTNIGLLILNKGKWNGHRIISESWITGSAKPHVREPCISGIYDYYDYQWRIVDEGDITWCRSQLNFN